ncbi:MAG: 2-oxoacid:acceptor oxidoreductase family protein [Dehalococcoidia bacterium]|nr:2-oxoacid:acceptor oxidoreductase family protein [Dehalococcoidia bacterium]
MAGIGGKGVLTAGKFLLEAGAIKYKNVVYFPSYSTEMRGSPSECTVILSESPIGSPVLQSADAILIFDQSQLANFENRLRPSGLMVIDSTMQQGTVKRKDVRVLEIPAMTIANAVGDVRSANLVLLGGYVQATGVVPMEIIESEIKKKFKSGGDKVIAKNIEAVHKGAEVAAEWAAEKPA